MDRATLEAEGWQALNTRAFSAAIGPTFMRGETGHRIVGLITDARNANDHMGIVHGGVLLTFADIALGCAVVDAIGAPHCTTVQLQYQFVAAAPVGSFISCEPELVRRTSQLVFVRCVVKSDGRTVGSADGIFKVLDPARRDPSRAG